MKRWPLLIMALAVEPEVFEQYHTTYSFTGAAPFPVRGPHAGPAALRLALDDVEACEESEKLLVESDYRERRSRLQSDEGFRALSWKRRREKRRKLKDERDARLEALQRAAASARAAIEERIKEKQ